MPKTRLQIGVTIVAVLLVLNIVLHFIWNWGLITVKVKDVPIGQVVRSIERQGWVKIYTNIDPQTKISMYVDHVTLPEAMETLAANADAQWHLGFFVGPTSAQVQEEIRSFSEGVESSDDNTKTYSYPTPLAMISDESTPVADPRKQVWPGYTAPPPAPPPSPSDDPMVEAMIPQPDPPATSVQGYLKAFAQAADIWIMAPASWDTPVPSAPPASSSISSAIKHFVSAHHGSVTQGIVLRGRPARVAGDGRPRGGGGGFRGGGMDMSTMETRADNAINGLPAAAQPAARAQLQLATQQMKEVRMAPPEKRREMMMQMFMDRRMNGDNSWRRSPEKRAQMMARMVNNRMAAQGKTGK